MAQSGAEKGVSALPSGVTGCAGSASGAPALREGERRGLTGSMLRYRLSTLAASCTVNPVQSSSLPYLGGSSNACWSWVIRLDEPDTRKMPSVCVADSLSIIPHLATTRGT